MRPGAQAVVDSLTNAPGEWRQFRYVIRHEPTGVEIWTGNGALSVCETTADGGTLAMFTIPERLAIWHAVKVANCANLAARLEGKEKP